MSLVSTDWLFNNLNNVKIIDSSWHLPNQNRNPFKEYSNEHILNSIFFDIDKYSDQKTDLPHMLPKIEEWEKIVSNLGISNRDKIIVYDNSDLISSCRCWYTFLYFGHDSSLISVLNGGLKKWKQEGKPVVNTVTEISRTHYFAKENKEMVKSKIEIDENISLKKFKVIDARSKERFEGKEPEPRNDVKSGSIPNSFCLPFKELINENHTFKDKREIKKKFNNIFGPKLPKHVVFSCGSGITATVLALAYSLINNKYVPIIYDGSWAEYGKK